MEKSALITKNKHSTRRRQKGIQKEVLWIKRKKTEKTFPLKKRKKLSHWNWIPNHWKCRIKFRQWKKGTTLIVVDSKLAGIEERRISRNRSVKVRILPGATTHDMYDYLKPLLKKNPYNIILYVGINNSVNETSRDVLN